MKRRGTATPQFQLNACLTKSLALPTFVSTGYAKSAKETLGQFRLGIASGLRSSMRSARRLSLKRPAKPNWSCGPPSAEHNPSGRFEWSWYEPPLDVANSHC